jgi:hypothetical protein
VAWVLACLFSTPMSVIADVVTTKHGYQQCSVMLTERWHWKVNALLLIDCKCALVCMQFKRDTKTQ